MLYKIQKLYEVLFFNFEKKFKKIFCNSKTIAIVGNSKKLLDHNYGKLIDSHDFVIRFNRAPTKNYEKYVGQKTTLRVVGDGEFRSIDNGQGNFIVTKNKDDDNYINFVKTIYNSKIFVITDDYQRLKKNPYIFVDKSNEVFFFDNYLNNIIRFRVASNFNLVKKFKSYRYSPPLSSGILIVSLLALIKIKPSIFGFEFFSNSKSYNHYFANHEGQFTTPFHDKVHETSILRNLINDKKVIYF